ncbi:MAG: AraC family transcriptional regulator [Victivallaceae bacterium]|nr:AraC family transcriptional regulator [Victivallaceae bacterium]
MKNGKNAPDEIKFDRYPHELVYRSLTAVPEERFGMGLMFKSDKRRDYDNIVYPRFVLVLVLRGEGTLYTEDGECFELEPGKCFKRIPGRAETLNIHAGNRWVEFFIEIGPALYQALRAMRIIETRPLSENIELDREFFERLMQFKYRFKTSDERSLPLLVGEFAAILADCQRRCFRPRENRETGLVDLACSFLSCDLDQKCDIRSFCRRQGIGYERFRKLFRKQLGVSPWQYRIRRRLDLACALLQNPELKISEIAVELGYASAYDFSAQFKKYFKVAPAYYRPGSKITG